MITRKSEFGIGYGTSGNVSRRHAVRSNQYLEYFSPVAPGAGRDPPHSTISSLPGAFMHIRGDHAELVVGGRLDVRSAADARSVLHNALDSGQGDLVLDLRELDAWDATGLGVIMETHRRAGRCGRRLVLREVPPQMQRVLVATKLHRILTIAP